MYPGSDEGYRFGGLAYYNSYLFLGCVISGSRRSTLMLDVRGLALLHKPFPGYFTSIDLMYSTYMVLLYSSHCVGPSHLRTT